MTTLLDSTTDFVWNGLVAEYRVASIAAEAIEEHGWSRVRDQIKDILAEATDAVLAHPAPSLGGVALKLHLSWLALDLYDEQSGSWRRKMIGDLRRNEMLLAGVPADEAIGGLDLAGVRQKWDEAIGHYDHQLRLLSDDAAYAVAVKALEAAEAEVFTLPAPDVAAVIRKLEIFWSDDRFDDVDDVELHDGIIDDLKRLSESSAD